VQPGLSVRRFAEDDLPRVLQLLDESLGGGPAGRRPPEFFRWKHLDNPFGQSVMLLAEADGRLAGLRAFMRWRFVAGDHPVRAARAVDTATHPDFQGMGVFTRLTLAALDEVRGEVDLVFNTPNGKSGPGYLKMGWREVGRIPVSIRARHPLRLLGSLRPGAARAGEPSAPPRVDAPPAAAVLEQGERVARLLAREQAPAGRLATPRDLGYLRWRYGAAPLLGYRAVTEERGGELAGLAIFRMRPRGGLWESTVVEVLAGGDRRTAGRLLRRVATAAGSDHLTFHAPAGSPLARAALRSGFLPTPVGVSLVANPLVDGIRPDPTERAAWALSLGDLEVF
jgi:GNAT superfamily N-acetyltransferase